MSKVYDKLVVGCGSRGLNALFNLITHPVSSEGAESINADSIIALEASSRIGGTQFLISRLTPESLADKSDIYESHRKLPDIQVWWERNWTQPTNVDWQSKDWAYTLPQWNSFFQTQVELKVKASILEVVKPFVQLEKPVSEIRHDGVLWEIRSGEKIFQARQVFWTLGLKSFQNCFGKKESEEFLEKNPNFIESARDAEGALVSSYTGVQNLNGEAQFVAVPVRHEQKLYLTFVSISETSTGPHIECFTFLHTDLLKQPKELSFFEKSLKRTLKHTLANYITELSSPTIGIFDEAKGYTLASPWRLKNNPDKGIFFVSELGVHNTDSTQSESATQPSSKDLSA